MTGEVGNPVIALVSFGSGQAGLNTVGYTLKNLDGTVFQARTVVGVSEISPGDYAVQLNFTDAWQGIIFWDTHPGSLVTASEAVEIFQAGRASEPSPLTSTTGTVGDFVNLLRRHGSVVRFHRDESFVACPCRTKQGNRNPEWHLQHPASPVCNEAGMLPQGASTSDFNVRAFVQPVQAGAVRRLTGEVLMQMFGEIQSDDHIGFFPVQWGANTLNFYDWGQSTEDYVVYNNRKFQAVSANLIPDPADGNPWHHWEIGLRLLGVVA